MDQNGSSESGELWSDCGYTKVELIGLTDGLDMGKREEEESKMTLRILAYVIGLMELPFTEIRKTLCKRKSGVRF